MKNGWMALGGCSFLSLLLKGCLEFNDLQGGKELLLEYRDLETRHVDRPLFSFALISTINP